MSTNKAIGLLDNFYEGPQKDHRNVTVKIKCKAKKRLSRRMSILVLF